MKIAKFINEFFQLIISTSFDLRGSENEKMIYIIKVQTNKEENALDMIHERAAKKNLQVYSIAAAHGVKGYIFLEAEGRDVAEEAVYNLPYIKGILSKNVAYEEIQSMVEPTVATVTIKEGDIVEIIGSTLKGEKAKVLRIDKQKEEVTVSLLGAVIPLPVTIKLDNVKVIRRDGEEG